MASMKKSSFQKRNQESCNVVKGTKPSLYYSQLLISSGISSLDALLGGGIPVGSLVLINEDEYDIYGKFFLKYFLSEGIASNHSCLIASKSVDPEKFVNQLPILVDFESQDEHQIEMTPRMSIAWRYENLKTAPSSFQNHAYFGHYFDLSKHISEDILKKSDIAYWSGFSGDSGESFETSQYWFLLKFIEEKLRDGKYFSKDVTSHRNILRIALHQLDSPLWQPDIDCCETNKYLYIFLYHLRALLRNAYSTCFITLPFTKYYTDHLKKCIHLCDVAVQLQSFVGTDYENLSSYKDYHGFFIIQKMAAINCLTAFNPGITNLAFKLKRKKLVIEEFHLPPELEESAEREQDDSAILTCSTTKKIISIFERNQKKLFIFITSNHSQFNVLSGVCLVTLGCVVLNDSPRVLLSELFLEPGYLAQPLLYYVALALIFAGLVVFFIASLGFWAFCHADSILLMGCYMFFLISLLVAETSFGSVATLCPQIIGMSPDRDQMVVTLMNNYGVPGRSQYTAAMDLAQTLLQCCGMLSGSDYDGSRWWVREQETRHQLRVPHSCCFLSNIDEKNSFLNPRPINSSLCQARTNSRYQYGRHVKGCIDKLNEWFKEHVTIFLVIGFTLVVIQLTVLLCALLVSLKKSNQVVRSSSFSDLVPVQETVSTSKRHKRSERNLTPKPERKKESVQAHFIEGNDIVGDKSNQSSVEIQKNTIKVMMDYPPKKLNSGMNKDCERNSENFLKRVNSPSLPLVLRNEHFQRYNKNGSKRGSNTLSRKDSVVLSKCNKHRNEEPNVYFTPHYDSTEPNISFRARCHDEGNDDDLDYYNYNSNNHKNSQNLKSYFSSANEKYGFDNDTYESFYDT